jgi:16S rRNA (uracil1498-N3)-methyltransferase
VITLLIDPGRFSGAGELPVEGDAYRHLFRARRLAVGDRLRLVDGAGRARWGEVLRVGRAAAAVALREPAPANEPHRHVELFVPTLRPERAAWLVEKATELGATAVHFLNTERAPRDFGDGTLARLRRVAAAAVEQCHRSLCPAITGPQPLAVALGSGALRSAAPHGATAGPAPPDSTTVPPGVGAGFARRWLLDPGAPPGLPAPPPGQKPVAPLAPVPEAGARTSVSPTLEPAPPGEASIADGLLVGPEGGWAPGEVAALSAAGWRRVALGPRILRIETAAIAGLALLLLAPGPEAPKT